MINIELTAEQWNTVLTILAAQRFDQVVGLIQSIQQQAAGQIVPPAPTDEEIGGA